MEENKKPTYRVEGFHYDMWTLIEKWNTEEEAQEFIDKYLQAITEHPKDFNWEKFQIVREEYVVISERTIRYVYKVENDE